MGSDRSVRVKPSPHPFTPDCIDPGYRSICRVCSLDAAHHPYYRPPAPRRATA